MKKFDYLKELESYQAAHRVWMQERKAEAQKAYDAQTSDFYRQFDCYEA